MTPRAKKVIVWTSVTVLLLAGGWWAYTSFKKDEPVKQDDNLGADPKGSGTGSGGGVKDTSDAFPLQLGSKGANVVKLQKGLNALGASLKEDGVIGAKTAAAALLKGYPLPIDANKFNQILSGKSQLNPSAIKGKTVWANSDVQMLKDALGNSVLANYSMGGLIGIVESTGSIKGVPYAKIKGSGYVPVSALTISDPKRF